MKELNDFFKSKLVLSLSAIVLVVFFSISLVKASTTIGDDINTAGQLITSGVAHLNGGINVNDWFVAKNDTQFVGIGDITPTAKLGVVGSTNDKFAYAMKTTNSSNEPLFFIRNDGKISIGYRPPDEVILDTLTIQDPKASVNTSIRINGEPSTILYLGATAGYGLGATQHSIGVLTGQYDAYISYKKGEQDWGVGSIDSGNYGEGFGFWNNRSNAPSEAKGNKIYLDSLTGNVSIGGSYAPSQQLEVNGGIKIDTDIVKPGCNMANGGTFWVTKGGTGVADSVEVCAKGSDDNYAWRTIY